MQVEAEHGVSIWHQMYLKTLTWAFVRYILITEKKTCSLKLLPIHFPFQLFPRRIRVAVWEGIKG